MRPTPSEVDAVIFDMIAAEAAQVPDDTSLDDPWSGVAFDPQGEFRAAVIVQQRSSVSPGGQTVGCMLLRPYLRVGSLSRPLPMRGGSLPKFHSLQDFLIRVHVAGSQRHKTG